MEKMTAIARPYAKAAYDVAMANQQLSLWHSMLENAVKVLSCSELIAVLANNVVSDEQYYALLVEPLQQYLNQDMQNFLALLAANKRVAIIPEILNLFCQYESLNKQLLVVKVITAIALSDKQQKLLNKKLTAKLACNISLQCSIDKKLLGGIVIKIGDTVIDSSIPKQLMQLLEFVIR
jgi:F-type H+-transporting ATPase subunit delta